MKISRREKILLIILAIAVMCLGYYKFIFMKQQSKLEDLRIQKEVYNLQLSKTTDKALSTKEIKEETKILNAKIKDVLEGLFPPVEQEKIILIMDEILKNCEVQNTTLSISDDSIENMNFIKENETNIEEENNKLENLIRDFKLTNGEENETKDEVGNNSEEQSNLENISVKKLSVNMNYAGTYDQLRKLLNEIETFEKKILINNLSITSGSEDDVMGNISLEIYLVPDIYNDEFRTWKYENDYGKDNPFKSSSTGNNTKQTNSEKKYDFIMNVRPVSSDLPTIVISKTGDKEQKTYVYADNEGTEQVEIYFTEEKGKYYYKYKSSENSYPEDFNELGDEFIPNGSTINLKIYSIFRNSDIDVSGANILVYNKTNKSIHFDIESDDSKRPRINIVKKEGSVIIQ